LTFQASPYISSAGLRVLLSARKKVQPLNGTVVLCGLQPFVREVFEMTGFTRIFPVVSNPEEMP
jgi:anti-anti-sigma factor